MGQYICLHIQQSSIKLSRNVNLVDITLSQYTNYERNVNKYLTEFTNRSKNGKKLFTNKKLCNILAIVERIPLMRSAH